MQHARESDVVGVVALAADEPVVLDPLAARADTADLDLVYCLSSHALDPLSFSAAHSTDFTMFW